MASLGFGLSWAVSRMWLGVPGVCGMSGTGVGVKIQSLLPQKIVIDTNCLLISINVFFMRSHIFLLLSVNSGGFRMCSLLCASVKL